jgi:hypothetical protein
VPYEREGKEVYVLFNNLSMFEDAARFTEYLVKRSFPRITASTGLASIREILEKTHYPASKDALIKRVGWKLVEVEDGKQVRLETFLADLPSKIFKDVEELLKDLRPVNKIGG